MRDMKVLIINQCFYPDVAATAQHAWDLARSLRERGHQVTAVASRSPYGERGSQFAASEIVDGITIERIGASRFGKAGLLGRAADFLMFQVLAAWRALLLPRQDVVVCLTTPPFVILVGIMLKALRGTRVVYWVMDVYPDIAISFGALRDGSAAASILHAVHRWALGRCDRIVVLGRCMRERIVAKGVDPAHLEVINTWADPNEVSHPEGAPNEYRERWAPGEEVLLMYSGNFGLGHDFETLAAALSTLEPIPGLRLALVGGGKCKNEFIEMLRAGGACRFEEAPHQPRQRLGALLCSADVHLVTLKAGFEGLMVPSKFYGAMSAGKPVIFIGPKGSEVALAIGESGGGIVVEPGDAAGLRDAIASVASRHEAREAMGSRARRAANDRWSAEIALRRWCDLIERTAAPGRLE